MFIRSSVHAGAIPEALLLVSDSNEESGPCWTLNVSVQGFVFGLFQAYTIKQHRISNEGWREQKSRRFKWKRVSGCDLRCYLLQKLKSARKTERLRMASNLNKTTQIFTHILLSLRFFMNSVLCANYTVTFFEGCQLLNFSRTNFYEIFSQKLSILLYLFFPALFSWTLITL